MIFLLEKVKNSLITMLVAIFYILLVLMFAIMWVLFPIITVVFVLEKSGVSSVGAMLNIFDAFKTILKVNYIFVVSKFTDIVSNLYFLERISFYLTILVIMISLNINISKKNNYKNMMRRLQKSEKKKNFIKEEKESKMTEFYDDKNKEFVVTGKHISIFFAIIFTITSLLFSVFTVKTEEVAIISRFGKVVDVKQEGLHLKIPFVDKRIKMVTKERTVKFGNDEKDDFRRILFI